MRVGYCDSSQPAFGTSRARTESEIKHISKFCAVAINSRFATFLVEIDDRGRHGRNSVALITRIAIITLGDDPSCTEPHMTSRPSNLAVIDGPVLGLTSGFGAQLGDWERFNVFRVAALSRGHPLETIAWALLQRLGLMESLALEGAKVRRFLRVRPS